MKRCCSLFKLCRWSSHKNNIFSKLISGLHMKARFSLETFLGVCYLPTVISLIKCMQAGWLLLYREISWTALFREYMTEIDILSQFRHMHLVPLIGYCSENIKMVMVYENKEHGTLKNHIYDLDNPW
ncbi:Serine-threonine/tyrosine-protein kinase [Hirschfeldia incana]|nr:Serine-threonine/tyrosine-protein kinase [Hirschfeldia incana]KAJ0250659.1 Serine-threonine/tyrosine-protein kinase [Hirschfeldia incana]KAJ0250660.1 Serine-threonine/tyrosine-protein kinase [Hirschfeldia incana]